MSGEDLDPKWESQLVRAANNVTRGTALRDRLIAEAVAAGQPLRKVGALAGMTQAGAAYIAKRELAKRQDNASNPLPQEDPQ